MVVAIVVDRVTDVVQERGVFEQLARFGSQRLSDPRIRS